MGLQRPALAGLVLIALALHSGGCSKEGEETNGAKTPSPQGVPQAREPKELLHSAEMFRLALETARQEDDDAAPIRLTYSRGNQEGTFREGEFIFRSPKLAAEGQGNDAVCVKIESGKVVELAPMAYGDADPIPVVSETPLPNRAIKIAMGRGLEQWWEQHPEGIVQADLSPRKDVMYADLPGTGRWVWTVRGHGEDVPVEFRCFIEAGTLRFLKVQTHPLGTEEEAPEEPSSEPEGQEPREAPEAPDAPDAAEPEQ
ncbi:MAG: hypothetical protein ACLF0G_02050 [Candidatus Brocadiia bacterium]